jgi:hypothetical protein
LFLKSNFSGVWCSSYWSYRIDLSRRERRPLPLHTEKNGVLKSCLWKKLWRSKDKYFLTTARQCHRADCIPVVREIKHTNSRDPTHTWETKKQSNGEEIGHTSNPDDSVMQLTVKIALEKYCRGTIFSPM